MEKLLNKPANVNHDILKPIVGRWSPRAMADDKISDEEMHAIIEAGSWAPSCFNYQPWRFIWGRRGSAAYDKIRDLLDEFNQSWVDPANILMLAAMRTKEDGKENYHAKYDLGQAVAYMNLQAQSMDVAVHQMAGFDHERAMKVYEIPKPYEFSTAIAFGKYGGNIHDLPEDLQDQEHKERERKSIEDISNQGGWSKAF